MKGVLFLESLIFLFLGCFLFFNTLKKPAWFWAHPKAMIARNLFGDKATTIIYFIFSITFIGISTLALIADLFL